MQPTNNTHTHTHTHTHNTHRPTHNHRRNHPHTHTHTHTQRRTTTTTTTTTDDATTNDDMDEKIRAGASLVQLVTGLIYGGPMAIKRINQGLVKLLARDGYATVADAVGKSAQ